MAKEHGAQFFEVSAEENISIKEALYNLAEKMLEKKLSTRTMRKLLKTFALVIPKRKRGGAIKNTQSQLFLRWLDTVFQGQYLPSLSVNYVAINKDFKKLTPQLY